MCSRQSSTHNRRDHGNGMIDMHQRPAHSSTKSSQSSLFSGGTHSSDSTSRQSPAHSDTDRKSIGSGALGSGALKFSNAIESKLANVLSRASRSVSPAAEMGVATGNEAVTSSRDDVIGSSANQGPQGQHKRSNSDPAVKQNISNGNYGNKTANQSHDCIQQPTTPKRNTENGALDHAVGIPVNVSPKNLVLRFDAKKDNLSFSAIEEDSETTPRGSYFGGVGGMEHGMPNSPQS